MSLRARSAAINCRVEAVSIDESPWLSRYFLNALVTVSDWLCFFLRSWANSTGILKVLLILIPLPPGVCMEFPNNTGIWRRERGYRASKTRNSFLFTPSTWATPAFSIGNMLIDTNLNDVFGHGFITSFTRTTNLWQNLHQQHLQLATKWKFTWHSRAGHGWTMPSPSEIVLVGQ